MVVYVSFPYERSLRGRWQWVLEYWSCVSHSLRMVQMYTVRMCVHYIHTRYTVHPCTTSSTEKTGLHTITASTLTSTHCRCLYWGSEGLLFKSACCLQEVRHTFTMHHMSCHLEPPTYTHCHTFTHEHNYVGTYVRMCARQCMHTYIRTYMTCTYTYVIVSHCCLFLCLFRLQ